MKILILGAAGFVGSTLAAFLIQTTNHVVVSVDDLSGTPDIRNLAPARAALSRHTFYLMDASDKKMVSTMLKLERPDVVISSLGKTRTELVNLVYQYCKNHDPDVKFLVLHTPHQCLDATTITSDRLFGNRQRWTEFIPLTIYKMLDGIDEHCEFSNQRVGWVYIHDLLTALSAIIKNGTANKYHISSSWFYTEAEVANRLADIIGTEYKIDVGSPNPVSFSPDKNLTDLGWAPKAEFETALFHTIKWYDMNRDWVIR